MASSLLPVTERKKVDLLVKFFFNRTDFIPFYAPWKSPGVGYFKDLDGVIKAIESHVGGPELSLPVQIEWVSTQKNKHGITEAGHWRLGSYQVVQEKVLWGCIDFDGSNHKNGLPDPLQVAREVFFQLKKKHCIPYLEKSGSGCGWHIWIFFQAPGVEAQTLRAFLEDIIPKKYKHFQIEVFPKQNFINQQSGRRQFGSQVWLPFYHKAKNGGNLFYEFDESTPENVIQYEIDSFEYTSSLVLKSTAKKLKALNKKNSEHDKIDKIDRSLILSQTENSEVLNSPAQMSLQELNRLLKLLPANYYDDYNLWIKIGLILHEWDPIQGLIVWETWSQQSDKYQTGVCEKKWKTFNVSGDYKKDKITVGSLYAWVKQAENTPIEGEKIKNNLISLRTSIPVQTEPGCFQQTLPQTLPAPPVDFHNNSSQAEIIKYREYRKTKEGLSVLRFCSDGTIKKLQIINAHFDISEINGKELLLTFSILTQNSSQPQKDQLELRVPIGVFCDGRQLAQTLKQTCLDFKIRNGVLNELPIAILATSLNSGFYTLTSEGIKENKATKPRGQNTLQSESQDNQTLPALPGGQSGQKLISDVSILRTEHLPYGNMAESDPSYGVTFLQNLFFSYGGQFIGPLLSTIMQGPVEEKLEIKDSKYGAWLVGNSGSGKTFIMRYLMSIWGETLSQTKNLPNWSKDSPESVSRKFFTTGNYPVLLDGMQSTPETIACCQRIILNLETSWPVITSSFFPEFSLETVLRLLVFRIPVAETPISIPDQLEKSLAGIGFIWIQWLESQAGHTHLKKAKESFETQRQKVIKQLEKYHTVPAHLNQISRHITLNLLTWDLLKQVPALRGIITTYDSAYKLGLVKTVKETLQWVQSLLPAYRIVQALGELLITNQVECLNKNFTNQIVANTSTCQDQPPSVLNLNYSLQFEKKTQLPIIGWIDSNQNLYLFPHSLLKVVRSQLLDSSLIYNLMNIEQSLEASNFITVIHDTTSPYNGCWKLNLELANKVFPALFYKN